MTIDLRAIMRRNERQRRMVNDPDLTGDALLFALALSEVIVQRREQGRRARLRYWVHDLEVLAKGEQPERLRGVWVRMVIADDVPRYEPRRDGGVLPCTAPMIRRDGPCGKHGTNVTVDRDPETGEAEWVGWCARHKARQRFYEQRRQDWFANGKPVPPPNRGGILRRYFTANWDELYRWAAPHLTPRETGKEPSMPRPQLRLVREDE